MFKGTLEICYKGALYEAQLSDLKFKIDVALVKQELDKLSKEIEAALGEIEKQISQLGLA